jgi:uncharacterized protein YcfJ
MRLTVAAPQQPVSSKEFMMSTLIFNASLQPARASSRLAIGRLALAATLAALTGQALATEYGTVVTATPITAQVPVPQTQCVDQQQLVQQPPSGGGALVGALLGGAIGHNVGGGFGRAVATGLGVVAGAAVGDRVEANATPPTEATVRRCSTVTTYQNRVLGYDVVYDYQGQRYSTRLAQATAPGAQIALAVTVAPQGEVLSEAPAPAPVTVVQPAPVVYSYGYDGYYPAPAVAVLPRIVVGGYWGGYWGRGRWH